MNGSRKPVARSQNGESSCRPSGFRLLAFGFLILALQNPLLAKCPVSDGMTLVMRVPVGNLVIDTTGRDAVDVQVNSNLIQIQETCGKDMIQYTSNTPSGNPTPIEWRIVAPRNIDLDLVTLAGNIGIGDSDGNVTARTSGGSVTAGQIKGDAAIITQGGSIKTNNIGGNAELRSPGGSVEVGNINGNAEFQTARTIRAGIVNGRVSAETAGGTITIQEVRGDLKASAKAGDISIGDAARIDATTGGGSITSRRVRGPFQGHTESGDIKLDNAAAWVEASTGFGSIVVKMVPENINGDLHVDLQSGVGDITVYLPQRMKASVDATVERPAFQSQHIISDFPMNAIGAQPSRGLVTPNKFYSPSHSQTQLNGGGNRVILHTSLGKIEIKRQ
ncbi:MAG TPA: hypothetical protein VE422_26080 [Terriglobia bacterium]|nr:hypothetical protein [Terriglobia bacterium]